MPGHPYRSMREMGDAVSLYVARFPMSAVDAETWFEAAAGGDLRLPSHPDRPTPGDGKRLAGPPFRREPENGTESSSHDLSFLPSVHGMMRVRGLYGAHDPAFASTLTAPAPNAWLKANMFIDLDSHREYVGGLFLARHPRAVRDVSCHLSYPGGREVELVSIRHWPGVGLEGHRVLAIEQRPLGFGMPREITVEDGLVEIDWNGACDRIALSLIHPEDGVAWWLEPTGFLRSIQTNIDFIYPTRAALLGIQRGRAVFGSVRFRRGPPGDVVRIKSHSAAGWHAPACCAVIQSAPARCSDRPQSSRWLPPASWPTTQCWCPLSHRSPRSRSEQAAEGFQR
jgi:hypothetical protein